MSLAYHRIDWILRGLETYDCKRTMSDLLDNPLCHTLNFVLTASTFKIREGQSAFCAEFPFRALLETPQGI